MQFRLLMEEREALLLSGSLDTERETLTSEVKSKAGYDVSTLLPQTGLSRYLFTFGIPRSVLRVLEKR